MDKGAADQKADFSFEEGGGEWSVIVMLNFIYSRLSNGSVGANFALRTTQNLLRGTCSKNGLGANQSKSLDLSK